MRLTRHAKNRLRFIQRRAAMVSEVSILEGLLRASEVGRDMKGNRKLAVRIEQVLLTVVVDDARQIVITIWREE